MSDDCCSLCCLCCSCFSLCSCVDISICLPFCWFTCCPRRDDDNDVYLSEPAMEDNAREAGLFKSQQPLPSPNMEGKSEVVAQQEVKEEGTGSKRGDTGPREPLRWDK